MNIVAIFTGRPIATTLLAIGIALAGFGALFLMPVAPLPFPVAAPGDLN